MLEEFTGKGELQGPKPARPVLTLKVIKTQNSALSLCYQDYILVAFMSCPSLALEPPLPPLCDMTTPVASGTRGCGEALYYGLSLKWFPKTHIFQIQSLMCATAPKAVEPSGGGAWLVEASC